MNLFRLHFILAVTTVIVTKHVSGRLHRRNSVQIEKVELSGDAGKYLIPADDTRIVGGDVAEIGDFPFYGEIAVDVKAN